MTDKISQQDMIEMFGDTMPIEAVKLLWNSDGNKTIGDIRIELRAIAAKQRSLKVGSTWQHVKRGSRYEIVDRAKMQIENKNCFSHSAALESITFIAYRNIDDGSLWFRPEHEFMDGRFVEIVK